MRNIATWCYSSIKAICQQLQNIDQIFVIAFLAILLTYIKLTIFCILLVAFMHL